MNTEIRPPRLAVVAAMIGDHRNGSTIESAAARLGSRFRIAAEAAAAARATPTERALAKALQGGDDQGDDRPKERVMAELLLLAGGDVADTGEIAIELSQAFVPSDDSSPAMAREDRASAFADVYRRLALHQLNSQVRNKAAAILGRLSRR